MPSIRDARQHFASVAEAFAKPDWETSHQSMTHELRSLVEKHKNNTPPERIEMINRAIVEVQKFELRIHHRCRVKKPDEPIHPDPFWYYNGYDEALDSLVWYIYFYWKDSEAAYRKEYPNMLWGYELHCRLFWTLNLWKSYCQVIKDAPEVEASEARARIFRAEIDALMEEFPPFPEKSTRRNHHA